MVMVMVLLLCLCHLVSPPDTVFSTLLFHPPLGSVCAAVLNQNGAFMATRIS